MLLLLLGCYPQPDDYRILHWDQMCWDEDELIEFDPVYWAKWDPPCKTLAEDGSPIAGALKNGDCLHFTRWCLSGGWPTDPMLAEDEALHDACEMLWYSSLPTCE